MASLRARRTRVYDCNYNMGQSYYKPALDKIDRKYSGRSDIEDTAFGAPRSRLNFDNGLDEELMSARGRANRAITEESVFDSRGARAPRGLPLSAAFDNEIDEDVQASLNRFRATKSKMSTLINNDDLDDSFTSTTRRAKRDFADKIADFGVDDEDFVKPSIRSRARKLISDDDDIGQSATSSLVSSFKRTAISSDNASESSNSAASMRAKATKARLADIETEMEDRSQRQLERENRAANLKKILAENDIEIVEKSSSKHVSF